jgi:hypothetical protein
LKKPIPFHISALVKVVDVVSGVTEAKAPDVRVAFSAYPRLGVTVNASSPARVVATPAESLKVT